jgi:hypothetical protein
MRYSVRIKLTDFINTEYEDAIIKFIRQVGDGCGKRIFLKLWYVEKDLSKQNIIDFVKKHEIDLEEIGTNIHAGEHEVWTQRSWFNIRKRGETSLTEYRHEYYYTEPSGILDGLKIFWTMVSKLNDFTFGVVQPKHETINRNPRGYRVVIKKMQSGST